MQDRVAARVAGSILPTVRVTESMLAARRPTEELDAYGLVLRGLPLFWKQEEGANTEALALFDRAAEIDPGFALAHGMRAWCLFQHAQYFWSDDPLTTRQQAVEASRMALSAGQDDASTLVAASAGLMCSEEGPEPVADLIERALAIDPNNAWGWLRKGWLCAATGDDDDAAAAFETAQSLSPADPFLYNILMGKSFLMGQKGDYAGALQLREKGIRAAPHLTWPLLPMASLLVSQGDIAKARATIDAFCAAHPSISVARLRETYPAWVFEKLAPSFERAVSAGLPHALPGEIEAEDHGAAAEPAQKSQGDIGQSDTPVDPAPAGQPSIAVMPFSLSGSDPDFPLAGGLTNEVTTALARVHGFFVISHQSARASLAQEKNAEEIGRVLGARYIVNGAVQAAGPKLRVHVYLIDATTQAQVWSERFDGDMDDLFGLQDRVAARVAGSILPSVRISESALAARRPTEELDAY